MARARGGMSMKRGIWAWVVLAALGSFGCSSSASPSSPSDGAHASPPVVQGTYQATSDGPLRELDFHDATHYSAWRSAGREDGTYAFNDDRSELSLTSAGQTTKLPFRALATNGSPAPQSLHELGLVGGGTGLVQNGGSLISSFQAGPQNFQACDVGKALAQRASDNLGKSACEQTSTGDQSFGSSCTGNGGQPEYWCADFVKWVWGSLGVDVGGLTAAAGSFYTYGQSHGTLSNTPHVGDAVVFNSNGAGYADHVAIVTTVNDDGTIETVSGDWNGEEGSEAHFSSTSHVIANTPAYPGTVGSKPKVINMTISGFISPVGGSCSGNAGNGTAMGAVERALENSDYAPGFFRGRKAAARASLSLARMPTSLPTATKVKPSSR